MSIISAELCIAALNKSQGGICILNNAFEIEFVNDWLQQALSIPVDEIDKINLDTLYPVSDKPRLWSAVKSSIEKGVASKLSTTFEPNLLNLKDPMTGEALSHSTNVSALEMDGQRYCLINVIDESKPLKREKLLADYIQKLKDAESELQRSRDIAIEASQAKTQFIARMSHQLRTPLNAIVGFSELLANEALGELNDDQLDSAKQIFTAGSHLSEFVAQILMLSESTRETEVEPLSVTSEIATVIRQHQNDAAESKINVDFCPIHDDETTLTNNRRLIQALLKNVFNVAINCQTKQLNIILKQTRKGENTVYEIRFQGDYERLALMWNENAKQIIQSTENALNTEFDVSFGLEMSTQLALAMEADLIYQPGQGISITLGDAE